MKIFESKHRFSVASPAKLNLFLEIRGRRDDGYHELDTVMTHFSIFDYLEFTPRSDNRLNLTLATSGLATSGFKSAAGEESVSLVPSDQNNLVIKALQIMRDLTGCSYGADILLSKHIPVQAGLGGASGNAAAALLAGNRMWRLNLPLSQLKEMAGKLGSDIAFFLGNGWARCTGRGEQVHNLNYRRRLNVIVAKPQGGHSTQAIYSRCVVPDQPISSDTILSNIKSGRASRIGRGLFNRLQSFASDSNDDIARMRDEFERTPCLGHQLTGSGSCYFGIYPNHRAMSVAAKILENRLPDMKIFTGQTLSSRDHYYKHED